MDPRARILINISGNSVETPMEVAFASVTQPSVDEGIEVPPANRGGMSSRTEPGIDTVYRL
jgi:hypothetical protein